MQQQIVINEFWTIEQLLKRIDRVRSGEVKLSEKIAGMQKGDCFIRVLPVGEGKLIYGEVQDAPKTLEDAERWAVQHSDLCADGEEGCVNLATVFAILNREQFEMCRRHGWPQTVEGFTEAVKSLWYVN